MQNTKQYPKVRNLDTTVFKVTRPTEKGICVRDLCFSDLSEEEMKQTLSKYDVRNLTKLCITLGKTIHYIGDELKVCGRTRY